MTGPFDLTGRRALVTGALMISPRPGARMCRPAGDVRVPANAAAKGGVAQRTKALANEWASRDPRPDPRRTLARSG